MEIQSSLICSCNEFSHCEVNCFRIRWSLMKDGRDSRCPSLFNGRNDWRSYFIYGPFIGWKRLDLYPKIPWFRNLIYQFSIYCQSLANRHSWVDALIRLWNTVNFRSEGTSFQVVILFATLLVLGLLLPNSLFPA